MHKFLKGMGVVLIWLCAVGGVLLIAVGLTHIGSRNPVERHLGLQLLIAGLVAAMVGIVQAALVWAAGRGLEILEQVSRFYYREAQFHQTETKASRELLSDIVAQLATLPRVLAPEEVETIPPAEDEDERFKLMTPEEAERMFDTVQGEGPETGTDAPPESA